MYAKTKYTHYLKLTPLGDFFFGGESFQDKGNQSFYFQASEDLPQQTSLLGLLRYQLLLQNGLASVKGKFYDAAAAGLAVGSQSFDPTKSQSFGLIQQLSPVLIVNQEGRKFAPFQQVKFYKDEADEDLFIESKINPRFVTKEGKAMLSSAKSPLKVLDKFNSKLGLAKGFRSIEPDSATFLDYCKVYVEDLKEKIGIYKTDTLEHRQKLSEAEKEGFFKFQFKRLQKGYAFGFYATLDLQHKKLTSNDLVYLGKDRCAFKLEVRPIQEEEQCPFQEDLVLEEDDLIWLVSDANLNPAKVYAHCNGAMTDDRSFRCLISSISDNFSYFSKPKVNNANPYQMRLSVRYNLMKAGSLLKVAEPIPLATILTHTNFNKIGYNHFLKIKSN